MNLTMPRFLPFSMASVAALLFLVVATMPREAHCWGPLSHSIFACLDTGSEVSSCVLSGAEGSFSVGSQMPDAFAFGSFTLSGDASYLCRNLVSIHDLVFAGHAIQFSANYSTWPLAPAFAAAFASHMVADYVGLFPAAGILSSPFAVSNATAATPVWIPEWAYMSDIDALLAGRFGLSPALLRSVPSVGGSFSQAAQSYSFLAAAIAYVFSPHQFPSIMSFKDDPKKFSQFNLYTMIHSDYHQINPAFPLVPLETVQQCAAFWQPTVAYCIDRAAFLQSTPAGLWFLQAELPWFFPKVVSYSGFLEYLDAQVSCISHAMDFFTRTLASTRDPALANAQVIALVSTLYAKGACTVLD